MDISILPVARSCEQEPFYLILFEDAEHQRFSELSQDLVSAEGAEKDIELQLLRSELMQTKEYLQKIIEEKRKRWTRDL